MQFSVCRVPVVPVRTATSGRRVVAVRASPKQEDLSKKISEAISEAEQVCSTDDKEGCASAWDTVEELSAEKSHEKAKNPTKDPLEQYCSDEPDADECRVHDV